MPAALLPLRSGPAAAAHTSLNCAAERIMRSGAADERRTHARGQRRSGAYSARGAERERAATKAVF
eukprot:gene56477-18715_t